MSEFRINQLESVLNLTKNQKIVECKTQRLSAPGDNYASVLVALNITIAEKEDTKELHLVSKLIPPNQYVQKVFLTQEMFTTELSFYKQIVPILTDFQKEQGAQLDFDFFPKFYGGRLNLNNSKDVDVDATIILENLKKQNYVNFEKHLGFDLDTSKLILKNLAQLHGVSLSLRLLRPDKFKQIASLVRVVHFDKTQYKRMYDRVVNLAASLPELDEYVDRVRAAFVDVWPYSPSRELFKSIVHNDLWSNNFMFQLNDAGRIVANKIVDFQMIEHSSCLKDVLFFVFSSVKIDVVREHYDDLVQYYYGEFIRVLKELKCDTEAFTYDAFLDDLDFEAKHSQFFHVTFMLMPIYINGADIADITEWSQDFFDNLATKYTDLHKRKLRFLVEEFARRNWI